MASKSKIKDSAKNTVISYNGSAVPLGQRNDIDELAIIAHESGRKDYKGLFEKLPRLEELKEAKVDAQLAAITPAEPPAPAAVTPTSQP